MSFIDKLYAPMTITGENIDSRYFKDNGDGTYTPTPLFIHNVARDVVKFAKARIFELDDDNKFHTASVRQVKDTWAEKLHKDEWAAKYGNLTKEATKRWYAYRDAHPDEFETKFKRIAIGGEDEARFFAGYSTDIAPGLNATVQLYNAANELLARFAGPDKKTGETGPEYASLPFEEPLYSKEAFASAHAAVRAKISEDLGIPEDKFEVGKVEKQVCRISNKKCAALGSDDTEMESFVEGLIKHLTSSNAVEFKAKREECFKLIDRDFVINFNDSAKELKAEDDINESIAIYTRSTEDTSPVKIITISKEEPTDPSYKYFFNVTTKSENLHYSKTISTKADLRKALNNTIMMIEDIPEFKKYVPDIEKTLENL